MLRNHSRKPLLQWEGERRWKHKSEEKYKSFFLGTLRSFTNLPIRFYVSLYSQKTEGGKNINLLKILINKFAFKQIYTKLFILFHFITERALIEKSSEMKICHYSFELKGTSDSYTINHRRRKTA